MRWLIGLSAVMLLSGCGGGGGGGDDTNALHMVGGWNGTCTGTSASGTPNVGACSVDVSGDLSFHVDRSVVNTYQVNGQLSSTGHVISSTKYWNSSNGTLHADGQGGTFLIRNGHLLGGMSFSDGVVDFDA